VHDLPDTLSAIEELLGAAHGAVASLTRHSARLHASRLRREVERRVAEWRRAVGALDTMVAELGGWPMTLGGSSAVSGPPFGDPITGTDQEVLADCDRAEHAALEAWADALSEHLPPAVRRVLLEQHVVLVRGREELRRLFNSERRA
jgi:uncharacterized protein (TIGR02284 family)